MNIELWNKVKKRFEEYPECVDMKIYADSFETSCMTVGCIAGWTLFESGKRRLTYIHEIATELLGLDSNQAEKLFHLENWPQEMIDLYDECLKLDGHPSRAVLAAMNAFEKGEF
jgi:hypothetical protein